VPCNLVANYRCFGINSVSFSDRGVLHTQRHEVSPNVNIFLSSTLAMYKECNFEKSEPLIPLVYHEIRGTLYLCNV